MAKRSRKLSTRRPRRSNSSSRKTMKRTKRQPSKKRTLKKHSSKKHTLKKHSSKKRKSRRKSVRKRKKTKKVMKGGVFDGTYTPVFENDEVNTNNIKEFDNKSANQLLDGKSEGTWLIRQRKNPVDERGGAYVLATAKKQGNRPSVITIMESNTTGDIKYWFRSNEQKTYRSLENLIMTNPLLFSKDKELKAVGLTSKPTIPHETPDVLHHARPYHLAEVYGAIDYKVSAEYFVPQKPGEAYYYILTLLDGENNGDGTTVKIVIDSNTRKMSIPDFRDFSPTTISISIFNSLEEMFNYYKRQKFIYSKGTDRSEAVLLGNKIQ